MNLKLEHLSSLITVAALTTLQACPGTRSGNPQTQSTSLIITGSSQPASVTLNHFQRLLELAIPSALALTPPSLVDSNGATVTLSDAWISVKEVEFKTEQTESSGESSNVSFKGPYAVNLLDTNPSALDTADIPIQAYHRIKMKLDNSDSITGAPAELSGYSIYLQGSIGSANFTYQSTDNTSFEISGANGITPESGKGLLMVIRFASLFKKINLASLQGSTSISNSNKVSISNPCPDIDSSAHDLYTCFRKGIESTANFGKDKGTHDLSDSDDKVKQTN